MWSNCNENWRVRGQDLTWPRTSRCRGAHRAVTLDMADVCADQLVRTTKCLVPGEVAPLEMSAASRGAHAAIQVMMRRQWS